MRFSGAGMPTSASRSMARLRAAGSDRSRWVRMVSTIWSPIRYSGLRLVSGSWKIMPMRLPRMRRISSGGRLSIRMPDRQDLAAGDAAGRIDQADHGQAGDGLAGAGFADHAQHLALGDVERDAVDGAQRAAAGDELDLQVTHGENGSVMRASSAHRSFGLSASRSQSPSRLMDRISPASAMPGKATIHHSPANR